MNVVQNGRAGVSTQRRNNIGNIKKMRAEDAYSVCCTEVTDAEKVCKREESESELT